MASDSSVRISLSTADENEQSSLSDRLVTRLNVSTEKLTLVLTFLSCIWLRLRPHPNENLRCFILIRSVCACICLQLPRLRFLGSSARSRYRGFCGRLAYR